MKINLSSDFIPQIIVLPTYYSGQNNVSLFKLTYHENDMHIFDKNFYVRQIKTSLVWT